MTPTTTSASKLSPPKRILPRVVYMPRAAERHGLIAGLAAVPATSKLLNI